MEYALKGLGNEIKQHPTVGGVRGGQSTRFSAVKEHESESRFQLTYLKGDQIQLSVIFDEGIETQLVSMSFLDEFSKRQ